ncbi:MAG: hypothetical protein WEG36_00490 [Gemmatimonadota bacterium]
MRRSALLLISGILLLGIPWAAQGQEEVQAVISGQLLWDSIPADTGTVVLHRVTPEEAGAVDSVTVGNEGRFTLTLPGVPVSGSGETLFAASRFEGILYYGRIIEAPADLDSLYTIRTFNTEPAPPGGIAFPVRTRELWIEQGPMGWVVTDRFVLANPRSVTYVPDGAGGVVWRYPLPASLRTFRVIEAGPAAGEVRFEGGSLLTTNPVTPDGSYYWIQYELDSLSVEIPLPGEVETALLIARESTPPFTVEGLAGIAPEEIGLLSTDRVWFGQGLRDQVVRIRSGRETPQVMGWLSVALALLLVLAGVWVVQRGGRGSSKGAAASGPGPAVAPARLRRDVLVEIARLDEEFRASAGKEKGGEGRYRRLREALLAELEAGPRPPGPRR